MSYRNYIGGHWVESDDGATLVVRDPADDTVVGEVPLCGAAETRRAIAAAAASLPGLQATEPATRAERVSVLSRLMDERRVELAALLTREQGKPLAESEGEIDYARSYLDTAVLEFRRMRRERSLDAEETGKDVFVEAAPVGVVGVITPWNFPLAMLTKKLGPAGCLGCPMVVKPAEDTPLTTLLLAELAEQAGFPPGAFNVVTGSPEAIGGELMSDPRVRLVSFTGSTETGRLLVRA
ncbi:MAG: aldehyde dehydrogenase family protein, partial [Planctomycetota bacterium]|nr:aldehyde dehydrogenase family protein [Planctomycetota bacterium]